MLKSMDKHEKALAEFKKFTRIFDTRTTHTLEEVNPNYIIDTDNYHQSILLFFFICFVFQKVYFIRFFHLYTKKNPSNILQALRLLKIVTLSFELLSQVLPKIRASRFFHFNN